MKIRLLFASFLMIALNAAIGHGQELTPEKTASFADHLFEQGDYYRAITEYERLIFFYPKHPLAKTAQYQIALSYLKGGRAAEAIERFRKLADEYPGEDIGKRSLFMLGEAYSQKSDYQQAIDVFERFLNAYPDDVQADTVRIKIGWSYLRQGNWRQASEEFRRLPADSSLRAEAEGLAKESENYPGIPAKSPYLAGGLSAIIPGAGQLYVGRPRDAAISFLLNATFIWGAVEAFRNHNNVTGGILLFFESGWYLGNIYTATSSAHKYNRSAKQEFIDRLSNQYGISYYRNQQGTSLLAFTMLF